MKPKEKKILFILFVLFSLCIINTFFSIFKFVNIQYLIFWMIMFTLTIILIDHKQDRYVYKKDVLQITIMFVFGYIILTYLSGLYLGFKASPYSLKPLKIIMNITPILMTIYFQEILRYEILKNTTKKPIIILTFIIYVLFDLSLVYTAYNFSDLSDIYEFSGVVVIGSIAKNMLFTYATYKGTYKLALIYRMILEIIIYIVPITPDLGIFLNSIVGVILPMLLFLRINTLVAKKSQKDVRKKFNIASIMSIPLIGVFVLVIGLTSNLFTYSMMAVGSNSMKPTFQKGDAVIIEKINKKYDKIKVDDILVFKHDGKIVFHRVIKIRTKKDKLIFNTKGDNNDTADAFDINESDVVGTVKCFIPVIGVPSVWLSEQS